MCDRALKWHYDTDRNDLILNETRSSACEIVAWRFLARLEDGDAVRFCLYEIPDAGAHCLHRNGCTDDEEQAASEVSPLLHSRPATGSSCEHASYINYPAGSSQRRSALLDSVSRLTFHGDADDNDAAPERHDTDATSAFQGLNALEIAAIASAKRFLGRSAVQRIVTGIWHGDVIFWDSLSPRATKAPRFYDPATADPYSRLRVPKYVKCWEAAFFSVFLCLYYAVLLRRVADRVTATEAVLWVWIAAFCYDEFCEWLDAGSVFYVTDIWNVCDVILMLLCFVFVVLRECIARCETEIDADKFRDIWRHSRQHLHWQPGV